MKYAVEQRYYDSGKVDVCVREVPDSFQDVCKRSWSLRRPNLFGFHDLMNIEAYDLYIDAFDNKDDAENFLQECQEES